MFHITDLLYGDKALLQLLLFISCVSIFIAFPTLGKTVLMSLFFSFATNDGFDLGFQHLIAVAKFSYNDQPRTKYFLKDQLPHILLLVAMLL